jgi:uncharacterized repeat protein (TIGR04076 family)
MAKMKITVVKTISNKTLFGDKPPLTFTGDAVCPRLKEGQEFVFDPGQFPEGFCPWAYADIQRDITHIRMGGSFPWIKEKNAILSCCTDGARPVIFKIEMIEG